MSMPRPPLDRFGRDRTGQSETLAVLLLVALTVVGGGTVLMFGASAIDDATASVDVGKAEHAMTQLDSKTSLVAHGSSDTQRVDFGRTGRGTTAVDEDSGRMIVRIVNGTNGNETILDEQLGTVTYERGQTTLAYQGGGVWRRDGNGSTMVSPPEFHYQRGTLTLPLVRVESDGISGRSVRIVQRNETAGEFPNATRSNPLTKGRVHVTVQSDYYRAWGTYFEERTSGNVTYDHANESATIELITPFKGEFDNILASTGGSITANGGDPPTPSETGTDYPSADGRIESRIDDCLGGGCEGWTTDVDDAGTYYTESDVDNDITVDTSGGNVGLVVNGSFDPDSLDITGSNNVTVYVRDDAAFGEANAGGNPGDLRVLVHSSGEVDMDGNAVFVGLLYAPESEVDLNGKGTITGGLVGGNVDINGQPANDFDHDSRVQDVELDVGSGEPRVLYLHVSVTTVEIEDG
ncbi:DUF7289 family protein [Haloplanus salilacus]|uniref:DUF7289 family protein n=1 Tax=Haloplanus salilacus TaxID=2949994 RepID=UPI0030D49B0B